MRIHTDLLSPKSMHEAITSAGLDEVWIEDFSVHNSRSRDYAFEVRLAAHPGRDYAGKARRPRNSGYYGAEGQPIKAATYDEHGRWIAELYNIDLNAIVGPYKNAVDFHEKTKHQYN